MRIILFLICAFSISCNSNIGKQVNIDNTSQPPIEELLVQLPDEAFYIEEYKRTVFKEERQIILQATTPEQTDRLSSNYMMDSSERSDSFLAFRSRGDEGTYISLKTWQRKNKSLIIGVNISVGDHCCDYSMIKLFHYKNRKFKEVTKKIFPKLTIEDFVPNIDAKTKALMSRPLQLSIRAFPESDSLKIFNHNTPVMFDLDYSNNLEKELDFRELTLGWKGDRFFIQDIRPLAF